MAKWWFIDGRTIARAIKTSGLHPIHDQINDSEPNWECPKCSFRIDNCNVSNEWPGLPIGVKFDPTDIELLEHLAAKCGVGNKKPDVYIDDFIPTIDADEGICCKYPEDLPGARKDGNGVHFFYRTTNAYTKGQRKRRKIYNVSSSTIAVRWHKTGMTKAIFKNGVQIGSKKIMVLYRSAVGGSNPSKLNWIMHQYHLGTDEEEKDGEYVVSKIFYQVQKKICENSGADVVAEESEGLMSLKSPRTPMINVPDPRRSGRSPIYEDVTSDHVLHSPAQALVQEPDCIEQKYNPSISTARLEDDLKLTACKDDSQAIKFDAFNNSFFDQDIHESHIYTNNALGAARDTSSPVTTTDLENLNLDSPLSFSLGDLYFPPEDSYRGCFSWL